MIEFKIVTLKDSDGDNLFVLQIENGFLKWIDNEDNSKICRVNRADMAYKFTRLKDAESVKNMLMENVNKK